jgi:hypothetical protein
MSSKARTFPKAGKFEIHSSPIFLLIRGEESELLVMKARMDVSTADAHTTGSRKRRVNVEVADWVATGKSRMLGGKIEFRLSRDKRQPKSFVTAGGAKEGDFPAQLRFGMRYEVSTPQGTVSDLTGVAKGPISAFPPRAGDVFNIQKDLRIGNVVVRPVACACASEGLIISLPG